MTDTKATPRWLRGEKEGLTQIQTPACIITERTQFFFLFQNTFTTKEGNNVNYNNTLVSRVNFFKRFVL
jgi:hypothetical protein